MITIIGILISVTVMGWLSVAARGRDSTRKSDLARINQVLKQYYADYKAYPNVDISQNSVQKGKLFDASWQLTNVGMSCQHTPGNASPRLITTEKSYISSIPQDPQHKTTPGDCPTVQTSRYLYLSTPSDTTGVDWFATGFALMATLETTTDRIDINQNPLFRSLIGYEFYLGNTGSPNFLDANYMVTAAGQ